MIVQFIYFFFFKKSQKLLECFVFLVFFCRFFVFGGQAKKKTPSTSTTMPGLQQQHTITGGVGRRRGSDRSLSGSAHELAILGVRDVTSAPRVPHSHSQSNLTDIPYRFVKFDFEKKKKRKIES